MKITVLPGTLILILVSTGCGNREPAGPTVHETQSVPHDAATALRASIRMGVDQLRISGGSANWLDGDFTYNIPDWKPVITYNLTGDNGDLRVEQPKSSGNHSDAKNEWNLKLNDGIATDLTIQFGAGDATLNLGSVTLRSLNIEMGAGTLNLDLRGHPKRSYDIVMRGGAGDANIYLPGSVGLYATAGGGIGDITVEGMHKDGDHWVNSAYGSSPVQVHADIKGGVGGMKIIAQ